MDSIRSFDNRPIKILINAALYIAISTIIIIFTFGVENRTSRSMAFEPDKEREHQSEQHSEHELDEAEEEPH